MIGATGAIYAVRKELFEPIPENIILDDVYTPLVCVKKGYRTVFERDAIAYDRIAETPHDEFRRKTRTLGGNYQIFFTMSEVMDPFKSRLAFQIISHKIFRVLVPFFMVTLFISNLIVLDAEFYQWILALQVMFYLMAWAGAAFRRNITGALGIPYLFCLMNLSAVAGFINFATGKIEVRWKK
jgi:cellulose synthase/poly-beta-1,6-N-acetylglucosamine synthase-like glycosyltransferase